MQWVNISIESKVRIMRILNGIHYVRVCVKHRINQRHPLCQSQKKIHIVNSMCLEPPTKKESIQKHGRLIHLIDTVAIFDF